MRRLYTLAVFLLLPVALWHLLWRARRQPDYLRHWGERFGFYGGRPPPPPPVIWIHAVSVGETRAAVPLVAALRRDYPGHRLVFSHTTPTGRDTAQELFGAGIDRVYLPYDLPGAMRRFLEHFRPQLGLIMETEIWPNLLAACRRRDLPVLLVNARLSQRSAQRYARLPALARSALGSLAAVAAQDEDDAQRLRSLGAAEVRVTGNLKFDATPAPELLARGRTWRQGWPGRKVLLAASTREGEERLILEAWRRRPMAGLLLLVVPRHPQRFDAVAELAASLGFKLQRRSKGLALADDTTLLLGDSMGEMGAYYAAADLACIGGSLLDFGSQNLIEACAAGTPVLVGPSTYNFAWAAAAALECGAAQQVGDADELLARARCLLDDAPRLKQMGEAGLAFSARHRGATERTLALIAPYLPTRAAS